MTHITGEVLQACAYLFHCPLSWPHCASLIQYMCECGCVRAHALVSVGVCMLVKKKSKKDFHNASLRFLFGAFGEKLQKFIGASTLLSFFLSLSLFVYLVSFDLLFLFASLFMLVLFAIYFIYMHKIRKHVKLAFYLAIVKPIKETKL